MMQPIEVKGIERTTTITRIIGEYGSDNGPLVIVIAGIHGNEPAGVFALQDLFAQLKTLAIPINGRIVGLAGNLQALEQNQRFVDEDMNRVWNLKRIADLETSAGTSQEAFEQAQLLNAIRDELKRPHTHRYFIDLHTTSSDSRPFIPFDDTLKNRAFVRKFPIAGILGIEEFLPGTLLSYLNEMDGVAIGYEAGQHDSPKSIEFHESFLWLALASADCMNDEAKLLEPHRRRLTQARESLSGFLKFDTGTRSRRVIRFA
ncbi:MAG: succinylglutamate desuccinylase/aspartoacylase family protein [Pirellulaceae bacterium]